MHSDFFDEQAATWDEDPSRLERARAAADAIRAAVPLHPRTRLLEYGAGTAMVSQLLADLVGPITVAEPSEGMRDVLTQKVNSAALPSGTRVWDLDLTAAPAPDERFDLVVTVMTLHHIRDLEPVLQGFAAMLAADGHLCVVDLEQEDGSFHDNVPDFDGHDGFSPSDLTGRLESAGFTAPQFQRIHSIEKDGATYPLFLAVATPSAV